ncbi:MAG: thioredoxin fold domain-containing protein [Pseudomonadota bacterium]|uniref:thioredoxin family protein n=1 Tax=Roseovarius TaxID=74030 RepID=UPI0022A8A2BA|nr:thioredoxin family protein [Roseovarius sp. EGI FJ00037]MCZ0812835.1 thioredoxin family protein [Roseovarius sp. EGI FJ00037]
MISRLLVGFFAPLWIAIAPAAHAVELIMVEQAGCHYCIQWKDEIGPVYPKTEVGAYAPLRMISISQSPPEGVDFARPVLFTPTFILVDEDRELARIEGYPGEDFFWGLLEKLLTEHTDFAQPAKTN